METHKLSSLLASKGDGIMSFIPLSERGGIDDNDGILYQGLGANQFVIRCIVYNVDDTGLAGNTCTQNKI